MTSYLNNGYEVMNYFAKFEKFSPHSIIIASFMTIGSHYARVRPGEGGSFASPYKIGSQNTPYKLGLKDIFQSKEQMKTKTREAREGKIKHIGLSVLYYIKSHLNIVSKTKP